MLNRSMAWVSVKHSVIHSKVIFKVCAVIGQLDTFNPQLFGRVFDLRLNNTTILPAHGLKFHINPEHAKINPHETVTVWRHSLPWRIHSGALR